MVCIMFKAHANSLGLPGQFVSAVAIDPVASSIITIFQVPEPLPEPPGPLPPAGAFTLKDASPVVVIPIVWMPKAPRKYVGTEADCETRTALQMTYRQLELRLLLLAVHPAPPGISKLIQVGVTVGAPVTPGT
jgi:hypothetical protein